MQLRAFFPRLAALTAAVVAPSPAIAQAAASTTFASVRIVGGEPIAVLFPDIGEPLRKVFTDIIEGIESQAGQRVRAHPVAPNQDLAELAAALKRHGAKVVVALGRQGLKASAAVDPALGVVVGGVSSLPDSEKHIGICLTPDPALLFTQLRMLLPGIRRVFAVFNPQQNDWLLKLAREAARAQSLELVVLEARDLAGAARAYETAFASTDSRRDALWLPTDATTVDEATILPIVLRESWNRGVPVFSSSFLHVKKGALFALYPNNLELGKNLANLAMGLLAGETVARGVAPLRAVHAALNLRTAGHIGVPLPPRLQRAFQFLYPEP